MSVRVVQTEHTWLCDVRGEREEGKAGDGQIAWDIM